MEREALDVDVLIVGGGPAGLSAALTLASLQQSRGGEPLAIAVLEKAREAGAHELSGAVLDPRALAELIPDYKAAGAPIEADVHEDRVYVLYAGGKLALPLVPPPLRNHGNHIVSLNRFTRWMATRVEEAGIDLFTGFPGVEVLWDGTRVSGVRTGDRGVDKEGRPKATFEAGVDIRAKVTIFCDGVRGNLTKQLLATLPLAEGREPQQYAIGIKELWELPADRIAAGTVMHTLGYPLRMEEFGGAFVYAMPEGRISLGLVVGLDYRDPLFDPYAAFQYLKEHPLIADLLAGGQRVKYGAKALPESGWNSIPQTWMDGGLIAGDAGAFLNSFRLKGIHLAMKTGMLAAETAFEAVRAGDTSGTALRAYQDRIDRSWVREELYPVRNVHQAFNHGLLAGLAFSALTVATGGRIPLRLHGEPGHKMMKTRAEYYGSTRGPIATSNAAKADRVRTFDKVTSVHFSGTRHDEDQPVHLLVQTDVCYSICGEEYGHPCQRFCPANVYEMLTNADGTKRLQINASNCVHCKTCDIMDPYQVITWVPPEGGGGPQYDGL
jgi:electron-transferring-flavoprotein dehydrogenase